MKKLFNYALLAAALLIGVNVNAKNVAKVEIQGGTPTDYDNLIDAFNAVGDGETATITMLDDANFSNCRIVINNRKSITWDLAGKTVGTEATATYSGFIISEGYFKLVNSSATPATVNLKNTWSAFTRSGFYNDKSGYGIQIYGSETDQPNYSTFIMDGDIKLTFTEVGYGIKVEKPNAATNKAYGVMVNINKGYVFGHYAALFASGNIQEAAGTNRPTFIVGKDAEIEGEDKCFVLDATDQEKAAKYYAKKYLGNESKCTEQEAKDWAAAYKESRTAIYGGGVANWEIYGYIHGGNGIYIKGGMVKFDGARVSATADEYHEPIMESSGFLAAGSAIILDSHESYGLIESITIQGSTITSDHGYAIEETATKGTSDLPVINVISGTFVGGITTTPEEKEELVKRGDITGGEWHGQDVSQYVNPANYTILEFVDGDGKNYQVVVPIKSTDWSQSIAVAAGKGEGLKYAKVANDETVSSNTTVEFVRIDAGKTVTVAKDATLDAGTLMTEGNSQVIVEAGGTLIISGEQGAYTYNENSIVIKASKNLEGKIVSGEVLINPAVVLNTTPKATVQYVGNSYYDKDNSQFVYDFFGAPFVAGSVTSFAASGDQEYATQVDVNRGGTNWENVGTIISKVYTFNLSKFDTPFGFYQLTSNNPSDKLQTYTIQGAIFGNTDAKTNFRSGWPGFSNAYMATADIVKFGEVLMSQGCDATIYTYEQTGPNTLTWNANNVIGGLAELRPMQAFMLRNAGAARNVSTDYTKMVWNPAMSIDPDKAPRMDNMSKASIRVEGANGVYDRVTVAQSEQFSAEYENGYDAEKYMNTDVNIYVYAETNLAILATDNVENTILGFNCKNAGKYTMTFSKLQGDNFALIDLVNNRRIEMNEGTTYEFLAEAGENDHRFMIVEGAKAPTNTPATKAAVKATKALINDQIVINNGERFFNMLGTDVK